jgi:adenosylcobinamide amidohydrolase
MSAEAPSLERAWSSLSILSHRALNQNRWLVWDLGRMHKTLGWTVVGGGMSRHQKIVWYQIRDQDLRPPVRPESFLESQLDDHGLGGSAAFLTSADLDLFSLQVSTFVEDTEATVVATVGLGNALRIGDPPGPSGRIGTINIACTVTRPLSLKAELEVLSLMTEARTAAMLDGSLGKHCSVKSIRSGLQATGTGTDCMLVASPEFGCDKYLEIYAGKHTTLGHLVGDATYKAVAESIAKWQARLS